MEEPPPKEAMGGGETSLNSIGEDILQDILSRLPALTFASAACVSRSWNLLSKRILTRPKLLSSLSLIPNLQIAVNEVLDKVLAEPIQPHFAIAYVGKKFSLLETHYLIMSKLGSRIPIIVSEAYGIIGSDSLTDEHKEVKWVDYDNENGMEDYNTLENRNHGIVLILGFVPGLKVCAIPLIQSIEGVSQMSAIDKFVTDIKYYTASVSGCTSPVGIIMFSDIEADMKPVLEKMDYAMSGDTVIIGDESGCFLCNNGVDSFIFSGSRQYSWFKNMKEQKYQRFKGDAIALVFAMDGGKVQGIGEIQLSLALSTGVSPIGPIYKGGSVRVAKDTECKCSTWLTARREGSLEKLDGETMLNDIEDEQIENDPLDSDLYIGVTKRRKCSIGSEKGKLVSSLAFHEVLGGDEEYLYVKGDGIRTGDTFQFFRPDPQTALQSRNNVFLGDLKQSDGDKRIVFGGLMFSCYGRGESFFGQPNVDSSAFLENFPGVSLPGVFCCGEIGRSSSVSLRPDDRGQRPNSCFLHVYAAVYLVMLYTP